MVIWLISVVEKRGVSTKILYTLLEFKVHMLELIYIFQCKTLKQKPGKIMQKLP